MTATPAPTLSEELRELAAMARIGGDKRAMLIQVAILLDRLQSEIAKAKADRDAVLEEAAGVVETLSDDAINSAIRGAERGNGSRARAGVAGAAFYNHAASTIRSLKSQGEKP